MNASRNPALCWFLSLLGLLPVFTAAESSSSLPGSQAPSTSSKDSGVPVLPRGTRLVLKDGTFQVVREYQRNGDRVRYFSMERGDWEELPSSLVDWDATAQAASDAGKASAAEVEKIHKQEEAKRMDNVADIDASLQVGSGVFLPEGEGMFLVEGKSIRIMDQVASQMKADKLRLLGQILSPVPAVPGKLNLVLPGTHATLRVRTTRPEFYLREAAADPEKVS